MSALAEPMVLTRDLVTGMEWNAGQLREMFHLAADIKARPDRYRGALGGRYLALIFEKPSLRTRVTFEVGITSMGGSAIFLDHTGTRLGERECIKDVARNLERWVHAIV
ncbi:MAG: ornithine carbamoyltransferase, partial [Candidatus Acidiferrales bacterium]